jgi:hypothetical protein
VNNSRSLKYTEDGIERLRLTPQVSASFHVVFRLQSDLVPTGFRIKVSFTFSPSLHTINVSKFVTLSSSP